MAVPGTRSTTIMRRLGLALFLAATVLGGFARADEAHAPLSRFYGKFAGVAVSDSGNGVTERDTSVEIRPFKRGFSVDWVSLIRKKDGSVKRKRHVVKFVPTSRPHIYESAMAVNMFGQTVPMDPMQGHPYVWAKIRGRTMTVYSMYITDTGSYEMQVYRRTLVPGGLDLEFTRLRDGESVRRSTAALKRVP